MRNAGWSISPLLAEKAPRQKSGKQRSRQSKNGESDTVSRTDSITVPGMARFSFPIPENTATIILPGDLTADDWEMVNSMVTAYISRKEKK